MGKEVYTLLNKKLAPLFQELVLLFIEWEWAAGEVRWFPPGQGATIPALGQSMGATCRLAVEFLGFMTSDHPSCWSIRDVSSAIVSAPLVVVPSDTLAHAIALMSRPHSVCESLKANQQLDLVRDQASCVLVIEDERVVGIVTERDIVRFSLEFSAFETVLVGQVMTQPVFTLRRSALQDIISTTNLLRQHHIRHLPIVDDDDRLIGLITHQGLLQHITSPLAMMRLRQVREVMATQVVHLPPQATLRQVAEQMVAHRVSSVVVTATSQSVAGQSAVLLSGLSDADVSAAVDAGAPQCAFQPATPDTSLVPVGILTERDLVQCQALGLSMDTYIAADLMSTPVFAVQPHDSLWTVQHIMQQHFIHRVVIIGERGELVGIVTQSSVLQALDPLEMYRLTTLLEQKVEQLEAEKVSILEHQAADLQRQVNVRTAALERQIEREHILNTLARQVYSSLDVDTILQTLLRQVRQLFGCERANVWQFTQNWRSVVVAESTTSALSLIGETVDDECFDQSMAEVYAQGRVRVVDDIYTTPMADCHREMLVRLHTRAKILVPLMCGDILWGLLNITEGQHPRQWQPDEIELVKAIAVQISIALKQAVTYQQLRCSEQNYATLAQAAPVGIFRTDAQGKCIYVNERWCQITGLAAADVSQDGWGTTLHPEDSERVITAWEQAIQSRGEFKLEYRWQRPDGQVVWVYGQGAPEWDLEGHLTGYVGTITNISEQKQAEAACAQLAEQLQDLNEQLEAQVAERTAALSRTVAALEAEVARRQALEASLRHMNQRLAVQSRTDGLTNVANRRYFDQQLTRQWQLALREKKPLSLVLMDIDCFKQYNDCYGHQQGDDCLQQIAKACGRALRRPTDFLARYGGEEFVVLLPNTDRGGAVQVAIHIQQQVAQCAIPHCASIVGPMVTLSLGIASAMPTMAPAATSATLLRQADQALYGAKRRGRDRYVVYGDDLER